MIPSTHASTTSARWETTWTGSRAELVALARDNCVVAAALRFIRVPIWTRDAESIRVSDLRFGASGAGGFAAVTTRLRPAVCPTHVPPWVPPRADVLSNDGS